MNFTVLDHYFFCKFSDASKFHKTNKREHRHSSINARIAAEFNITLKVQCRSNYVEWSIKHIPAFNSVFFYCWQCHADPEYRILRLLQLIVMIVIHNKLLIHSRQQDHPYGRPVRARSITAYPDMVVSMTAGKKICVFSSP